MKTVGDRLNTIEKQLNKKQETCVKNCLRIKWKNGMDIIKKKILQKGKFQINMKF